jgi:hypothetical protein
MVVAPRVVWGSRADDVSRWIIEGQPVSMRGTGRRCIYDGGGECLGWPQTGFREPLLGSNARLALGWGELG